MWVCARCSSPAHAWHPSVFFWSPDPGRRLGPAVAMQVPCKRDNTFRVDATGRWRRREQTGGVAGTEVLHYDGPGDSPSWTQLGSTWSRNVPGIGGEPAAVQESTGTTTFDLTDLHGDVVATASSSPTVTALLATYRFTEFGEPVSGGAGRFAWLGGKSRRTELSSRVIQMGARSYIPQLGRFLTPDPVPGGSANSYDCVNQDPIDSFDLTGESACHDVHGHKDCFGKKERQELHRAMHTARQHAIHEMSVHRISSPAVACSTPSCVMRKYGRIEAGGGGDAFTKAMRTVVGGVVKTDEFVESSVLSGKAEGCAKDVGAAFPAVRLLLAAGGRFSAAGALTLATVCAVNWLEG